MPSKLKNELYEQLQKRAKEEGIPDLIDKIAYETKAASLEELIEYLTKVNHPALLMGEMV